MKHGKRRQRTAYSSGTCMSASLVFKVPAACMLVASFISVSMGQIMPPKTGLTGADREEWRKVLRWPDNVEERWRRTLPGGISNQGGGLKFYSLDSGKYLVEVHIYPGVYQLGHVFMYYDEENNRSGPATLLKFKVFGGNEEGAEPVYKSELSGSPKFNKRRKELEFLFFNRVPGDCDSFIRYKFVDGEPVVVWARKQDCHSKGTLDTNPYHWPRKKL